GTATGCAAGRTVRACVAANAGAGFGGAAVTRAAAGRPRGGEPSRASSLPEGFVTLASLWRNRADPTAGDSAAARTRSSVTAPTFSISVGGGSGTTAAAAFGVASAMTGFAAGGTGAAFGVGSARTTLLDGSARLSSAGAAGAAATTIGGGSAEPGW